MIRRRKLVLLGAFAAVVVIAACTKREDQVLFEGHYYKAKAAPVDKKADRRQFVVTVPDVSVSLDGARAAGEYEGIRYCIANYGSSRIDWAVGPDTETDKLAVVNDRITFRGTCIRP